MISQNSVTDEWVYIVKSGHCLVLKKVRFDRNALGYYYEQTKSKRRCKAHRLICVYNLENKPHVNVEDEKKSSELADNYLENIDLPLEGEEKQFTFLEMSRLDQGDVFGLQDIVFTDESNRSELILVSGGAECILVRRSEFMRLMPAESLLKLKFSLPPYPNDENFIVKYFRFLQWENFKKDFKGDIVEKYAQKINLVNV